MLGSLHDADDALQDALLRAWRALPRFEGRSSVRTWLYTIGTNACLEAIRRRPKRVLPLDFGPPADPHAPFELPVTEDVWVEPYPDAALTYEQREGVELAFVAALQHLPGQQRAVLILREVLGFSAKEVADILDSTLASVNSTLQRARKATGERVPEETQQATLRTLGDERISELVETYMQAWEQGDVGTIVAMLTEDATVTMPPMATWFQGRDGVTGFLTELAFAGQERRRQ